VWGLGFSGQGSGAGGPCSRVEGLTFRGSEFRV
jgi:hypothetical protein